MMASWLGCFAAGSAGTGTRGQWGAGFGRLGASGLWRGPRGAGQKGRLEEGSGKWALGDRGPGKGLVGSASDLRRRVSGIGTGADGDAVSVRSKSAVRIRANRRICDARDGL